MWDFLCFHRKQFDSGQERRAPPPLKDIFLSEYKPDMFFMQNIICCASEQMHTFSLFTLQARWLSLAEFPCKAPQPKKNPAEANIKNAAKSSQGPNEYTQTIMFRISNDDFLKAMNLRTISQKISTTSKFIFKHWFNKWVFFCLFINLEDFHMQLFSLLTRP